MLLILDAQILLTVEEDTVTTHKQLDSHVFFIVGSAPAQ